MANSPLDALRATKVKMPTVRDRQDRADATMAPDARKARDIVRAVLADDYPANVTLCEIALKIAAVTAEQSVRIGLEDRAEAFVRATELYQREELQTSRPIAWLGDRNGQFPGEGPPPGAPEHHVTLAAVWLALLTAVNHATKVGVWKKGKYTPITLIADIDSAPATPAVPEWN